MAAPTNMQKFYHKTTGFTPCSPVPAPGLLKYTAAAVTIVKGDALHDNGSGLATNATTDLSALFLGIAAADCASGEEVQVIPANSECEYWVLNGAAAAQAAQTDIGEYCDLKTCNTIDVSDTASANGWGFRPDEIDISTAALANDGVGASLGGFVKGKFVRT